MHRYGKNNGMQTIDSSRCLSVKSKRQRPYIQCPHPRGLGYYCGVHNRAKEIIRVDELEGFTYIGEYDILFIDDVNLCKTISYIQTNLPFDWLRDRYSSAYSIHSLHCFRTLNKHEPEDWNNLSNHELRRLQLVAKHIITTKFVPSVKELWSEIRDRVIDICISLVGLEISAFEILCIIDHAVSYAYLIPMHFKWETIRAIKHFK